MVRWFGPVQLVKAGYTHFFSKMFSRRLDTYHDECLTQRLKKVYDYSCHYHVDTDGNLGPDRSMPRDEIWIDYISDTGEGWNSTFTIAYYESQDPLLIDRSERSFPRGDVLIFGGDQVYPGASEAEYYKRLVIPFESVLLNKGTSNQPHLFAIAGPRDRHDGLVSFKQLFCSGRGFAGRHAPQSTGYFALKLPHQWWLVGLDFRQLTDTNSDQTSYFRYSRGLAN